MTIEDIKTALDNHKLWLGDQSKGQRADLSKANLGGADLSGADLSRANLSGATMPGFKNQQPQSLQEAIIKTKEWLTEKRWVKCFWIKTPDGAYTGTCLACLHGAAIYIGGQFGPQLSRLLSDSGFTTSWNDAPNRTLEDVLTALDTVAKKAAQ